MQKPVSAPSLPLPLLRYQTSATMADKEKRRSGASPPGMLEAKATKCDGDRDFLTQAGVGELLRGAILKMVEARSDDPIGFLADHFCHLATVTDAGDGDQSGSSPLSTGAQEQQHLNRALWHLRLAHHSQRSGSIRASPPALCVLVIFPVTVTFQFFTCNFFTF